MIDLILSNPTPYYNEIKENFIVPSIYFPLPEIVSGGDTLSTYLLRYSFDIKCFHHSTEKAYELGLKPFIALKNMRNVVPLIGNNGEDTGKFLRIDDPKFSKLDTGVYRIKIEWDSRRPYCVEQFTYAQIFEHNLWMKSDLYKENII